MAEMSQILILAQMAKNENKSISYWRGVFYQIRNSG